MKEQVSTPDTRKKRPYSSPFVRSTTTSEQGVVMLACTGRVDCDALLGLGYECCAESEDACSGC